MTRTSTMSRLRTALEAARADISELRDRIADLQAKRAKIQNAPASPADIEAAIDSEIARVRSNGLLRFRTLEAPGGGFHAVDFDRQFAQSPFALAAALAPERLREAMIEAAPADGLGPAERGALLARIDREIFAAELAEEAALREVEAGTGTSLPRRENASAAVLLAPDDEVSNIAGNSLSG